MPYPTSPSETLADGLVHFAGLAFAIPASIILLQQTAITDGPMTATAIYAGCMILAFAASAIYHLAPFDQTRALLGRIDHAAIYFKIAGTYAPLVMVIGTGFAYGILGLVWALAVVGAIAKLFFWRIDGRGSLALYLGMGWLSALLIWPMLKTLPGLAVALIGVGGLIYSLGTIIYKRDGMPYQNAIWHVFVLMASICFFIAISLSVQAP
ncbi:MAG: PAQR family membrane homeostasis protein TrhA [Sulfitobacter sp.]